MNITKAKYTEKPNPNDFDAEKIITGIVATIDDLDWSVPIDPSNSHYAEIMRQVEAGKLTIEPPGGIMSLESEP